MPLLNEPAIAIDGVSVCALTLSAMDLEVTIRVKNPNIFGVTLQDLPFTVVCNAGEKERQIATGKTGRVKIRGKCDTVLRVPVTVHHAGIFRAVTSLVARGGLDVTIRGHAVVDCVVTCRSIPFTKLIRLTARQITDALSATVCSKE